MPISMFYDTTGSNIIPHTCSYTVPAGVVSVTFEIWGGGGGSGQGFCECDCRLRTGGGAGGGYSMITIPVTAGDVYTMNIGNGGVSSGGYGGPSNNNGTGRGCCGGTTFITGTGLTNFCAEGGGGGCANITLVCYGCACWYDGGGNAYGGTINQKGGPARRGSIGGGSCWNHYSLGGDAAGPGGGRGGWNMTPHSSYGCGSRDSNPLMDGVLPGGGGAGHGCSNQCNCCNFGGGRGASGLIKVTW